LIKKIRCSENEVDIVSYPIPMAVADHLMKINDIKNENIEYQVTSYLVNLDTRPTLMFQRSWQPQFFCLMKSPSRVSKIEKEIPNCSFREITTEEGIKFEEILFFFLFSRNHPQGLTKIRNTSTKGW